MSRSPNLSLRILVLVGSGHSLSWLSPDLLGQWCWVTPEDAVPVEQPLQANYTAALNLTPSDTTLLQRLCAANGLSKRRGFG